MISVVSYYIWVIFLISFSILNKFYNFINI